MTTETTTITVKFRLPRCTPFWAFAESMRAAAALFKGTATVIYQREEETKND